MNFTSLTFVFFFAVFYTLYLLARRHHRSQNVLLLGASYVFYAAWDWRFTGLLLLSTLVDYTIGRLLGATEQVSTRKKLLTVSVIINLSVLGFFKYFNFFADSLVSTLTLVGIEPGISTLRIILPIGISFYTFQTIAYTFDIYRRRIETEKNLVDYGLYVAFFPQLVAGPIERASRLLPQIKYSRSITAEQVNTGIFLILWGLFKKVVIADQLAMTVDRVFSGEVQSSPPALTIGAISFMFQIYCDFSGYTDIARGIGKLLGFELMLNFRLPYLAKNPSEFWRRWHISLSTWIRDYLYIPLGGNRQGRARTLLYLMIAMTLGGLWHGAAWNYVIWGFYHGVLLAVYQLLTMRNSMRFLTEPGGSIQSVFQIFVMFILVLIGWVIFRVDSIGQIPSLVGDLADSGQIFSQRGILGRLLFILPLLTMQAFQARSNNLNVALTMKPMYQAGLYAGLILGILMFGVTDASPFIYFRF
jgi:alginate O-acetyltransferase complex protein AlgI